jgi:hypothetical protein
MCVILTRAGICSLFEPKLHHCRPAGETSAAKDAAHYRMSIRMTKETTPMWVWLSVALLAIGTLAYVMAVYLIEHIMGFF